MLTIQQMFNELADACRAERSRYHLTLGKLVQKLEGHRRDYVLPTAYGSFNSYRGYYEDLSISPGSQYKTAGELYDAAMAALNKSFTGYKGGEFTMGPNTPLWLAHFGDCSDIAIVGINDKLEFITINTGE